MIGRVELIARSEQGTNRIVQHGTIWSITQVADRVGFSTEEGPWLRLEAQDGDWRWTHLLHDHDFGVRAMEWWENR